MVFHFISLEMSLFLVVMLTYAKLRQKHIFPLNLVRGMTIYLPPTKEDFDVLIQTNKPARQNAKGKVNKYDSKNTAKKAKFPMRTMPMNEELL